MGWWHGIGSRLRGDRLELTKKWLPSAAYAELFHARWREVFPATRVSRSQPDHFGGLGDIGAMVDPSFPAAGILELHGGCLVGDAGWAVSAEGYLLPEHSWFGCDVLEMDLPGTAVAVRRIKGSCLSLASDWASVNYGHFLLDCLPRLKIFLASGLTLSDVDHFLCAGPRPVAERYLDKLGVPLAKCIWTKGGVAIKPDVAWVTSFPGTRRNYPRWSVEYLRQSIGPGDGAGEKKIFIQRRGTRKIANEQELLPILEKKGFEVIDPGSLPDPPSVFARARVIAGTSGAGMADIVFCPPGAYVLEVMPSDHVYPYWYTLADSAGLGYGYLVGPSLGTRPPGTFGPSPFDFRVDPRIFADALDKAIATAGVFP